MSYPSAPWELKGYALQTVHLIDIEKARPFVPPDLEIISVWPGKTVGRGAGSPEPDQPGNQFVQLQLAN